MWRRDQKTLFDKVRITGFASGVRTFTKLNQHLSSTHDYTKKKVNWKISGTGKEI